MTKAKKPHRELNVAPNRQQQQQRETYCIDESRRTQIPLDATRSNTTNDYRNAYFHDHRYDSRIISDIDIDNDIDDFGRCNNDDYRRRRRRRLKGQRLHRSPSDYRRGRTDAIKSSPHRRRNSKGSCSTPASIILPTGDIRDLSFYRDDHINNNDHSYIDTNGHDPYESISNDWQRQLSFHDVSSDRSTASWSPYRQDDGVRSIRHTGSFHKQQKQKEYEKIMTPRTSSISTGSSSSSSSSSDRIIDGDRFGYVRAEKEDKIRANSRPKASYKTSLGGHKELSCGKSARCVGASSRNSGNRRTLQRSISYHPRMQVHPSGPNNVPRRTQSTIAGTYRNNTGGGLGGTNGVTRPFLPKRSMSINRSFYDHKDLPGNETDIWVERLVLGERDGPRTCFKSVNSNKIRQEPPTGATTIIYLSDMIERKKGQGKRPQQQQQLLRSPSYKNQRLDESSRITKRQSTKVQSLSNESTPSKVPLAKKKKKIKRKKKNTAMTSLDVGVGEVSGAVPTARTKNTRTARKSKPSKNKSIKGKKLRDELKPQGSGTVSSRRGPFFGFFRRTRR